MPELKGLLDAARGRIRGLLGDFPQGFNAGSVAGVAGYPGDIAYMLDTAGRALTGQDTMPAAQDFPGTTDYLAAKAGYPIPQSFSGQLGAAVGGLMTPGPGDLARFAPVLAAIPFWHGSPHKYDAVDLSKIGTGEGAQAYGWGYYGADAPDTALSYKNALSGDQGFYLDGRGPLTRQEVQNIVNGEESKYLDGVTRPSGVADMVMDEKSYGWVPNKPPKRYKDGSERLLAYEALKQRIEHPDNGHLYRGEYVWPDPAKEAATPLTGEDLLDWDRPLSEQSEGVRKGLTRIAQSDERLMDKFRELIARGATADQAHAALTEFAVREAKYDGMLRGIPEEQARPSLEYGQEWATKKLREAGIPGIRYKDQMSRGSEGGTYNYVMFDDKGIKLLERNGEPINAAQDFAARRAGKPKPYKEAMGADTMPPMLKQEPPKPDYGITHRPPMRDSGAPLFDATGGGNVYPDDVYSAKAQQYYGTGDAKLDKDTFRLLQAYRNEPDAPVTIYRAVPANVDATDINAGDWVTINKAYADMHGQRFDGGYKIIKKQVKAKDIYTNGDSIHEWGYDPN